MYLQETIYFSWYLLVKYNQFVMGYSFLLRCFCISLTDCLVCSNEDYDTIDYVVSL